MVHALHQIHTALKPGGLVVDTQPVSPNPPLTADGQRLGYVDMHEWSQTIDAIDALVRQTVNAGLYSIEHEQRLSVTDMWDSPTECVEMVAGWKGTRLPAELAERVLTATPPFTVQQEVRLRLLRAR